MGVKPNKEVAELLDGRKGVMTKYFFLVFAAMVASVAHAADTKFEKGVVLNEVVFLPGKPGPHPVISRFEHQGKQCYASLLVTWTFRSELKTRASAKVGEIYCGNTQMKAKAFVSAADGSAGLDLGCKKRSILGCEIAALDEGASFDLVLIK